MIVSGGENVSPVEIESILSLHAAVAEVAVAGLPEGACAYSNATTCRLRCA
jgi:acyl-CoA synthetase (AMP-forming)/AMP-acid ligase II